MVPIVLNVTRSKETSIKKKMVHGFKMSKVKSEKAWKKKKQKTKKNSITKENKINAKEKNKHCALGTEKGIITLTRQSRGLSRWG